MGSSNRPRCLKSLFPKDDELAQKHRAKENMSNHPYVPRPMFSLLYVSLVENVKLT